MTKVKQAPLHFVFESALERTRRRRTQEQPSPQETSNDTDPKEQENLGNPPQSPVQSTETPKKNIKPPEKTSDNSTEGTTTTSTESTTPATTQKPATVTPPKITGERPVVLCPTLPEDSRTKVKVSLIVTETGSILEPKVVKGVDESCNNAALAAANTLLFEPARLGDKAVAVKIGWSIAVKGPDKPKPPPIPTSTLSGTLLEKGTRDKLAGLVVKLMPIDVEVVTDGEV